MKARQLTLQEEFTKQHLEELEEKKYKSLTIRLTGKELNNLKSFIKDLNKEEKIKVTPSQFVRALINVVIKNEEK